MLSIRRFLLTIVPVCVGLFPACAVKRPSDIEWGALPRAIAGRHVWIPLTGAGSVEGKALTVRRESLLLDVTKTSDPARYPKGETWVPRAVVTEIRVTRHGAIGPVAGSAVGAAAGLVAAAGIAIGTKRTQSPPAALFVGWMGGSGAAGFLGGRALDRHTTILSIIPDRNAR